VEKKSVPHLHGTSLSLYVHWKARGAGGRKDRTLHHLPTKILHTLPLLHVTLLHTALYKDRLPLRRSPVPAHACLLVLDLPLWVPFHTRLFSLFLHSSSCLHHLSTLLLLSRASLLSRFGAGLHSSHGRFYFTRLPLVGCHRLGDVPGGAFGRRERRTVEQVPTGHHTAPGCSPIRLLHYLTCLSTGPHLLHLPSLYTAHRPHLPACSPFPTPVCSLTEGDGQVCLCHFGSHLDRLYGFPGALLHSPALLGLPHTWTPVSHLGP